MHSAFLWSSQMHQLMHSRVHQLCSTKMPCASVGVLTSAPTDVLMSTPILWDSLQTAQRWPSEQLIGVKACLVAEVLWCLQHNGKRKEEGLRLGNADNFTALAVQCMPHWWSIQLKVEHCQEPHKSYNWMECFILVSKWLVTSALGNDAGSIAQSLFISSTLVQAT